MLCSQGVPLADLGVPRADGGPTETDGRRIWRRFAENYHLLRGTPSRLWLDHTFETVFGLDTPPLGRDRRPLPTTTSPTASRARSTCPRALFERFNIEAISTTDSALDDLRWHKAIRESGWDGRVVPAYRPDAVVDPEFPGFADNVARLGEMTGCDTDDLGRLPRGAPPPPRLLQGIRRHQLRPRPRHRPHRGPAPGRGRGALRQGAAPARRPPRRPTPSAARC